MFGESFSRRVKNEIGELLLNYLADLSGLYLLIHSTDLRIENRFGICETNYLEGNY